MAGRAATTQGAGLIAEAPVGASPWETPVPGEGAATAAIVAAAEARVRAVAASDPPARRDAHPKLHGCVAAEFTVLDGLAPDLAVGLFAKPKTFQAWVRFSNGSATPQNDSVGDGRGMAVKVLGVKGAPSGTQDFIMINAPAFFVRNAADYVDFTAATNPLRFFFPSLNPFRFRLHELGVATSITRRIVSNPLDAQYYSMTPYLLGEAPIKFSARPAGGPQPFIDRSAPNFLRDNLALSLAAGSADFEFCVQRRTRAQDMPVEDPTIAWPEDEAPFTPVARIHIPAQVFATPERDAFGQNLSFTPWHGLQTHRPLGGINRVRRAVYEAISRLRHELNSTTSVEPKTAP